MTHCEEVVLQPANEVGFMISYILYIKEKTCQAFLACYWNALTTRSYVWIKQIFLPRSPDHTCTVHDVAYLFIDIVWTNSLTRGLLNLLVSINYTQAGSWQWSQQIVAVFASVMLLSVWWAAVHLPLQLHGQHWGILQLTSRMYDLIVRYLLTNFSQSLTDINFPNSTALWNRIRTRILCQHTRLRTSLRRS